MVFPRWLVVAVQLVGQCAGQYADVQDGCGQFIASGQYSCAQSFCSSCAMAANQCDLTCSFCQAGKYNDQSTGTSSCASCASQSFHTCTKAADCEYEGCVHPERPARASADTTRCFTSSDYEIKGSNHDKDGNLLVAWRCYATPKDDPGDLWLCPAKDKVCLLLLPPVLSTLI